MFRPLWLLITICFAAPGPHSAASFAEERRDSSEYLLHLPGIAGEQNLDRNFVRGLREGGYSGTIEIYDWPGQDPGLGALLARKRNEREAIKVAKKLERLLTDNPDLKIRLVAHSGGAGIAAWALERLPEEMQIETLVLLAPALSQRYDLSKSLSRVRTKAYAFTSVNDVIVLGAGTKLLGTIDGVKEEASGMRGFTMPEGADEEQYAKLVSMPYTAEWMKYDNIGDHIGPMLRTFSEAVISPIVQGRDIAPTTRPATTQAAR